MTDLNAFRKAFKAQTMQVRDGVREFHREVARAMYGFVQDFAPRYTGYYAANQRVSFTGQVGLSPASRVPRIGAHVGSIEITKAGAFAKLSSKKLPSVVTIGTAVGYAAELEIPGGLTGNRPVYGNARALTVEVMSQKEK